SKSKVQSPKSKVSSTRRAPIFYLLAVFLFALGLMSKPMLVTLPFVLLLLDYWPLARLQLKINPVVSGSGLSTINYPLSTLLLEKLPFFALSAASCVITFLAQQHSGAVADAGNVPLGHRWP